MRKLAVFPVLLVVFCFINNAIAGPFNEITGKLSADRGTNANEYHYDGVAGMFECDDDLGDVGNGVYLYYLVTPGNSPQIDAKKCVIERSGDLFDDVTVTWCSDHNACPSGYSYKTKLGSRTICTRGGTRTHGNTVFSQSGDLGCIIEESGVSSQPAQPATPVPAQGQSDLQRCLNSRATAEGKACCYLSASVATWDGAKCNCVNAAAKFEIMANGRGMCVLPNSNVAVDPAPGGSCTAAQLAEWTTIRETYLAKYRLDSQDVLAKEIADLANKIINGCNDKSYSYVVDDTVLRAKISTYDTATNARLERTRQEREEYYRRTVTTTVTTKKTSIQNSAATIGTLQLGLGKASVWKTADGDFNTARLVSDSVAGVVLGTAGGLITSSIIKKNQVSSGYEDISCTVGGQVVSSWGDEFRVGVR